MININPTEENCIMPEMPYCAGCKYGYIDYESDKYPDDVFGATWHCLYQIFRENK